MERPLLPPLIAHFLITVALGVAGVLVLALLYVTVSPWIQRHLSDLPRGPVSKKDS